MFQDCMDDPSLDQWVRTQQNNHNKKDSIFTIDWINQLYWFCLGSTQCIKWMKVYE